MRLGGPRPRRGRYDAALSYAQQRAQFGSPLARFQIVQEKLVQMLCEITAMQLYCLRIRQLDQRQDLSDTIAALGKLNNTKKAREVHLEKFPYGPAKSRDLVDTVDPQINLVAAREIPGQRTYGPRRATARSAG